MTTSITTARPGRWKTPLRTCEFRHIKAELLFGYRQAEVSPGQHGFIATPGKALLDLAYLHPGGGSPACLQNPEHLDLDERQQRAERTGKLKLRHVATYVLAKRSG